jgi:hypothetical protein
MIEGDFVLLGTERRQRHLMGLLARDHWNGKVPIPESCTEHRKVIECSKAVAAGLRQPGNWPADPTSRGVFSRGAAVLGTGSPTYDRFVGDRSF